MPPAQQAVLATGGVRDVAVSVTTTALPTLLPKYILNFAAATERLRQLVFIYISAPYGTRLPFPLASSEILVNEVESI